MRLRSLLSLAIMACLLLLNATGARAGDATKRYEVHRFLQNPIITPSMMGNAKEDINGPKLIKVPDWLPNKLGKYYLYFAHHEGSYIRLAYANDLHGPWKIYKPGVLHISDPQFTWKPNHIASPDIVIDNANHQLRLYFHTPIQPVPLSSDPDYIKKIGLIPQDSFVATSPDGIHFKVHPEILGKSYFKLWQWHGWYYALARNAVPLYRSKTGFGPFESIPGPFANIPVFKNIRHVAVLLEGDNLTVFYTKIGDAPEAIFATTIALTPDWKDWKTTPPEPVLAPETGYEGVALPLAPSKPGSIIGFEHALRDPDIYKENGKLYLLYSVEGERGIAIGELTRHMK